MSGMIMTEDEWLIGICRYAERQDEPNLQTVMNRISLEIAEDLFDSRNYD